MLLIAILSTEAAETLAYSATGLKISEALSAKAGYNPRQSLTSLRSVSISRLQSVARSLTVLEKREVCCLAVCRHRRLHSSQGTPGDSEPDLDSEKGSTNERL
jgi:hypothetical protein